MGSGSTWLYRAGSETLVPRGRGLASSVGSPANNSIGLGGVPPTTSEFTGGSSLFIDTADPDPFQCYPLAPDPYHNFLNPFIYKVISILYTHSDTHLKTCFLTKNIIQNVLLSCFFCGTTTLYYKYDV